MTRRLLVLIALLCAGPTALALAGSAGARGPDATPVADAAAARGTKIIQKRSRFGRMLFDTRGQAIYIFQRDRRNESRCFGECARLWPPVYTSARPRAGTGVRKSLLGSIRRGKRRQVTYNGRPLYFYAHEGPGQILCHKVFLNGGLWWVIGPDGKRRP